jgi:large subunit ribosomal protein L32e
MATDKKPDPKKEKKDDSTKSNPNAIEKKTKPKAKVTKEPQQPKQKATNKSTGVKSKEKKTEKEIKAKKDEKVKKEKAKPKDKAKAKVKSKSEGKKGAEKVTKKEGKKVAKKDTKDKVKGKEDEEEVEIVEEELEEEEEEEEEEYLVKQKPELTPGLRKSLKKRKTAKRKKPKFKRQEWFRYKRLGDSWRKPRGLHSKLRTNRKYRIHRVRVGYKTTEQVRGLHASGFKEVLVYNKTDLNELDPKLEAARIGHSVGTKKRIEIEEYADELGIRVLNRG